MNITDWLFSTCGSSHIGLYTCSRCGYELLRSGFERSFIKSSGLSIKSFIPTATIEARTEGVKEGRKGSKKNTESVTFCAKSMMDDFKRNFELGRTFHKNSIVKKVLDGGTEGHTYEMSCGKCGTSLGYQHIRGQLMFDLKATMIRLTFKPS